MSCKRSQWRRRKHRAEMASIIQSISLIVLDVMETHRFYGLCTEAENCRSASAGTSLTQACAENFLKRFFSFSLSHYVRRFCHRLCAVFGGVYCLKRQLDGVVVNEDKCKAIITGKQRLALEHLVVGQGHLPPEIVASEGENQISRGIFITDRCVSHMILYSV